jgi:hypothetical protein
LRPQAAQKTPSPGGSPQNGHTRAPGSMMRILPAVADSRGPLGRPG